MPFTISHVIPDGTTGEPYVMKVYNTSMVQVGTGAGYAFNPVVPGLPLYQCSPITPGTEPAGVAVGDHYIIILDVDTFQAFVSRITIVDGVDNPLASANAGLDGAQMRAALGLEQANLGTLVNALAGKNNVVDNLDGTFNIAIRNDADSATLRTIRFNPLTGAKTVV